MTIHRVAFEYNGQVVWINPDNEDVFVNGTALHVDELLERKWYSLYNAAVDALVQWDEAQMYGRAMVAQTGGAL